MANRGEASEFGGSPGVIQPDITRVPREAAQAGLGHESVDARAADRRGVRDAAMVVRRAGLKAAQGVVASSSIDANGDYVFEPYSEEKAREDYLNGDNY